MTLKMGQQEIVKPEREGDRILRRGAKRQNQAPERQERGARRTGRQGRQGSERDGGKAGQTADERFPESRFEQHTTPPRSSENTGEEETTQRRRGGPHPDCREPGTKANPLRVAGEHGHVPSGGRDRDSSPFLPIGNRVSQGRSGGNGQPQKPIPSANIFQKRRSNNVFIGRQKTKQSKAKKRLGKLSLEDLCS